MADLTVTAANVVPGTGATVVQGTSGAAITAGQTVYLDTATTTWKLCDANLSAAAAKLGGIAMDSTPGVGQPISVLTDGPYNPGATAVVGTIYVASGTAGGIAPAADLVSGWYTNVLGVGTAANSILVKILNSQVAVP